jgi:ATP-dependent DNA helicase RecG
LRIVNVDASVRELDWLSAQRVRQLERVGLGTIGSLLTHFPRRYEDRRRFDRFPSTETSEPVCVRGIVKTTRVRRLRGWQKMFDAVLEEEDSHALSEPLVCRWFNSHWVEKMIAKGQRIIVHGRAKRTGAQMVMTHPEFETVEEDAEESIHLNRITPIHRATEGLSPRLLRRIIWEALMQLGDADLPAVLPVTLDAMPRTEALRQIHFPDSLASRDAARRHLVLTEFFEMQLRIVASRTVALAQAGAAHCGPGRLMEKLHASLPFPLTGAQRRTIAEIRSDLRATRPMNRLLHGDVGSGKTLVALSAMLLAVEAGYQAALMAPTQILAEQHYLTFKRLLEPLGVPVFLRTSARSEGAEPLPLFDQEREPAFVSQGTASGSRPGIFVGTHALLYGEGELANLGLAVIDEQHKFGVMQRARLRSQSAAPDVLVMTATPIPRTLTMTVYGDLDVSTLDEVPAHRGKIITAVRDNAKLPEAVQFLREQLAAGRQAYIVYPLIDEVEKRADKAAAVEFEKWRELLAPLQCALLHGRMNADDKDAVMERFRAGETKALIATTVIEDGIDVPNATVMFIEDAARFGLAQLHQLRGRIGRGPHRSYCVLFTGNKEEEGALEKLRVLESTTDGFTIAEADLRLRGPGDILGTAQSGLPPLKLGDIVRDGDLMTAARRAAQDLFAADTGLLAPEHAVFRDLLARPSAERNVAEVS